MWIFTIKFSRMELIATERIMSILKSFFWIAINTKERWGGVKVIPFVLLLICLFGVVVGGITIHCGMFSKKTKISNIGLVIYGASCVAACVISTRLFWLFLTAYKRSFGTSLVFFLLCRKKFQLFILHNISKGIISYALQDHKTIWIKKWKEIKKWA